MAFKVATHYLQVAGFGYLVANLASLTKTTSDKEAKTYVKQARAGKKMRP